MTLTLTYDLCVGNFSPIYVTTKQKADNCNSFQVILRTDVQSHRHTPDTSTIVTFLIIAPYKYSYLLTYLLTK